MPIPWLYILLTLITPANQGSQPVCISSFIHKARQQDLEYNRQNDRLELYYLDSFMKQQLRSPLTFDLPIAVFVIDDPLGESVSPTNMDITLGIDLLNRVLDGEDPCTGNVTGIPTGIKFCLATRDSKGMSTSGIMRTSDALHNVDLCNQEGALKSLMKVQEDLFPNTAYVNLYIVSSITASCIPNGASVAGFAAYPAAHGTPLDGIVIESSVITPGNCDLFKVLVHETGHFFNLLHTFEGGCQNEDCLTDGDHVCDTPPDKNQDIYPTHPCFIGGTVNSCSTDTNPTDPANPFSTDQEDLSDNFMDYAPTSCAQYFTPGQVLRMHAAINGPRKSLLDSPGCQDPCDNPPSYILNINDDTILFGDEFIITPVGQNIQEESFWSIDQKIFAGPVLHWTSDTVGTLTFVFHPFHPDPTCSNPDTVVVQVDCYLQPDIVINNLTPDAGDTLILISSGINENNPAWYIDGKLVEQNDSLMWIIPTEGSYQVKLEYCNDDCCGTTVEYIQAGECPSGLEGSLWMFARDGITLDFATGVPVEIPPVQPSSFADEASSIVCDKNGNLLFYTNGQFVWDRNNTVINPGPQRLKGNRSSTNIMSLVDPENPSLYYIFYNTGIKGNPEGILDNIILYYAILDMRLNAGMGGLVLRDKILEQGMTEKLAATRHCNGRDWWLLSYQASSESFLTWLVDSDGIHPPVISNVGAGIHNWWEVGAGEINFSPDGTMIASVYSYSPFITDAYGAVELFKFDPATGIVFDPILVRYENLSFYGIEFSPNGRFLYVEHSDYEFDTGYGAINQYCLDYFHEDSIRNSAITIDPGNMPQGAMQTGRDGKIYISVFSEPYLSIIHDPNLKGLACGYDFQGLTLNHGESFLGLPSFPNGINSPEKPYLRGPYEICDSIESIKYFVAGNCSIREQEWKILGSSKIIDQKGDTVWISPTIPGNDTLIVTRNTPCRIITDTLIFEVLPCDKEDSCIPHFQWISADTILCDGEALRLQYSTNAAVIQIKNDSEQGVGYGDGSIYYQYPPPPDGNYEIYLWMPGGCDTTITFHVRQSQLLDFEWIRYDSVVCYGQTASLEFISQADRIDVLDHEGNWLEVNPLHPIEIGPLFQDTSFHFRLRHFLWDCDSLVNVSIKVENAVSISSDSIYLCQGDSVLLWSSWIKTAGIYDSLFQSISGCDSISQISVILNALPKFEKIEALNATCGGLGSINISASSLLGSLEYSINNDLYTEDSVFNSLSAGIYTLNIRDLSGCIARDTLEIKSIDPPSILNIIVQPSECGESNGTIVLHAFSMNSTLEYSVGGLFLSDSVFTALAGGLYKVAVKDTFGCVVMQTVEIDVLDGPTITDIQTTPEYCNLSDGSITINASSSNGPLTYSIDGSAFYTSPNFLNLQSGQYHISIQDSNNCQVDSQVQIDSISMVNIDSLIVNKSTCLLFDGSIEVLTEDAGVYLYSLDKVNYQSNPIFDSLPSGLYKVFLQSHNLCIDSATVNLGQSEGPSIEDVHVIEPICTNEFGQIEIIAEGNGLRYSIDGGKSWNPNSNFEKLASGTYLILIEDQSGCIDSQYALISPGESPVIINVEVIQANCIEGGVIKVLAEGYQLQYYLNDTINSLDGSFDNLNPGLFELHIIDSKTCYVDSIVEVTEKNCNIYVPNLFSPNGDGINDWFGPYVSQSKVQINRFEIFDRWGNSVFLCSNNNVCQWNGFSFAKPWPSGVYAWLMLYTDPQGNNKVLMGDVTLIR